ncbi:MAG: repeat family protein, partial [Actinomycetia bacterium]|nr:repeat family protein [Actinomycetes bacterium]
MMRRTAVLGAALGLLLSQAGAITARAYDVPIGGVVAEQATHCGAADLPETGIQGDVPKADQSSGRAEQGYNCGLALVGHTTLGAGGRRPDSNGNMAWAGHCAYVAGPGALFGNPSPAPGDG